MQEVPHFGQELHEGWPNFASLRAELQLQAGLGVRWDFEDDNPTEPERLRVLAHAGERLSRRGLGGDGDIDTIG